MNYLSDRIKRLMERQEMMLDNNMYSEAEKIEKMIRAERSGVEVVETITLAPLATYKPPVENQEVKSKQALFKNQTILVVVTDAEIVILGTPPQEDEEGYDPTEETNHSCDQMGCGCSHVLARIQVEKVTGWYGDIPNRFQDVLSK